MLPNQPAGMRRLASVLFFLGLVALPVANAAPATSPRLVKVLPGMVNVEIDLQFDKGEAPTGVFDVDPGSRAHGTHNLAEVVAEERPLETAGYLVAPDRVVAMDWTVHPRFIKAIHVRNSAGQSSATVEGYGHEIGRAHV